MDFSKRLESLELAVKDVLQLLQQKSAPPRRGSRGRALQEDPIISRLDGLSKSVFQLKKDFEHLDAFKQKSPEAHETADKETSSGDDSVTSNILPSLRQDTETSGGLGGANDLSSAEQSEIINPEAITIAHMGYRLAENLSRYGTEFSGRIHVSGLASSFSLAKISKRLADPDAPASLTLEHSSTSKEGVSKLVLAQKATFEFPDFSDLPQTAPQGHNKAFETVIALTPPKPVTYYVGPPLTPDFDTLLCPGKLGELGQIPGITTQYWHAGEKNSGTAFHYEDGAVRSCNITIAGFKLWILIDVSSNKTFEDFVKSLYPSARPQCSQWVRHLSILVSPKILTEKGIKFDLILAGPGDMVVTKRRQYHAVLNLTACFAIAINFALSNDPVLEPTTVCPKCGLYGLSHPALQQIDNLNGARKGGHAKRGPNGSVKRALLRAEFKPDGLEPDANGNEGQADEAIVETRSQQYADEEGSTGGDCEQSTRPEESPLVSHHTTRSPCPPIAAASFVSPPSSPSGTCSISSDLRSTNSPNDHLSTVPFSHIHHSPNLESATDIQLDSPANTITLPTSAMLCEQHSPAQYTGATSSLTHVEATTRILPHEHIAKRHRLCLSSSDATMSDELLRADPRCKIPTFDRMTPPDARILRLATAVRSRYAVRQFYDLVNAKRNLQLHNVLFPSYNRAHAAQHLIILNGLKNSKILTRLNQYLFATKIEEAKNGMLRVPSAIKQNIIQASGLGPRQYEYHLERGNQWRKVCGDFEGILHFMLSDKHNPFDVSPTMYLEMNDHELRLFHSLLADDYTNTICIAGKAFQQSLGGRDCFFTWESSELTNPLYELPEDQMLFNMKPVQLLLEDQHYTAEFPDWPDPTLIPLPEKQCDYCSLTTCDCYLSKERTLKPRIMAYPGKGLGLQAISPELGEVAYRRNELIGFLTGKLVPPGSLDNDRVAEFHHCQIDCRDEANEFRLMNHACPKHAVARLAKKRVSGRFRQSVLALKNINHGAEMTITYSEGHQHPCDGCQAHEIHH